MSKVERGRGEVGGSIWAVLRLPSFLVTHTHTHTHYMFSTCSERVCYAHLHLLAKFWQETYDYEVPPWTRPGLLVQRAQSSFTVKTCTACIAAHLFYTCRGGNDVIQRSISTRRRRRTQLRTAMNPNFIDERLHRECWEDNGTGGRARLSCNTGQSRHRNIHDACYLLWPSVFLVSLPPPLFVLVERGWTMLSGEFVVRLGSGEPFSFRVKIATKDYTSRETIGMGEVAGEEGEKERLKKTEEESLYKGATFLT